MATRVATAFAAVLLVSTTFARDVASAPTVTEPKPTIIVIAGDKQAGTPGQFNAKPFDLAVWNAAGTEPLVDTEVTFTVQSGGGLLAPNKDAVLPSSTLTLKTDEDGTVQAYYKQPFLPGLLSQIRASVADQEIFLQTTALAVDDVSEAEAKNRLSASSSSSSSAAVSSKSTGSGASASLRAVAASAKNGASAGKTSRVHALGGPPRIVLKTPRNGFFAVDPTTWAIAPTTVQ